jgi:phthalate 4,5-dioxygenase
MLNREENQILCRVGKGTPMGELFRRFWLPALVPWELPEADCSPVRLKLLGEDLVAFRDSEGKVGIVAENCPHRGASLFFGRNEELGLRCVYHGWKFDTSGACMDMPNEPPESNFKHKVKLVAYPTIEQGGIVWVYMGAPENKPELTGFLSNQLPPEHVTVWKRHQASNYMQALEGGIDPSHAAFLHSRLDVSTDPNPMNHLMARDKTPRVHVVDTDYGVLIGSRRNYGEDQDYWRTNVFLMPCYTMAAVDSGTRPILRWSGWVPIDDDNTMRFTTECDPAHPMDTNPKHQSRHVPGATGFLGESDYAPAANLPGGIFRTRFTAGNDYLINREDQKTRTYTGIRDAGTQDQAMTESMGAIYQRDREHLGTADLGIIASRRMLIREAKALRDKGASPNGALTPEAFKVNACNVLLPKGTDWVQGVEAASAPEVGAYSKML